MGVGKVTASAYLSLLTPARHFGPLGQAIVILQKFVVLVPRHRHFSHVKRIHLHIELRHFIGLMSLLRRRAAHIEFAGRDVEHLELQSRSRNVLFIGLVVFRKACRIEGGIIDCGAGTSA